MKVRLWRNAKVAAAFTPSRARAELATAAARMLALVDAHDAAVKDATQLEEVRSSALARLARLHRLSHHANSRSTRSRAC